MSSKFNARDANAYERLMGRWSRVLARPFLEFSGLASGERILDVGCGTGSLTFTIPQMWMLLTFKGSISRPSMSRLPGSALPIPASPSLKAMFALYLFRTRPLTGHWHSSFYTLCLNRSGLFRR
jgi:SAM-dependent methyltransferase